MLHRESNCSGKRIQNRACPLLELYAFNEILEDVFASEATGSFAPLTLKNQTSGPLGTIAASIRSSEAGLAGGTSRTAEEAAPDRTRRRDTIREGWRHRIVGSSRFANNINPDRIRICGLDGKSLHRQPISRSDLGNPSCPRHRFTLSCTCSSHAVLSQVASDETLIPSCLSGVSTSNVA